jgi:hypothetical protein
MRPVRRAAGVNLLDVEGDLPPQPAPQFQIDSWESVSGIKEPRATQKASCAEWITADSITEVDEKSWTKSRHHTPKLIRAPVNEIAIENHCSGSSSPE